MKHGENSQDVQSIEVVESNDDFTEGFIYVENGQLFEPVTQREFNVVGINMDNNTWNAEITPGNRCMDQSSYAEIKAIGFNTIRFGLAYSMTLSENFFEWLDENIQWAEEAGLKIILDMHAPQGGIQLRDKQGALAFWTKESVQKEFIDVWVNIAEHYKDSSCVIMYDLLNEPLVIADSEEEGIAKYVDFMQRLIQAIREVDENHVMCVEGFSIQRHNTSVDEFSYVALDSEEWYKQFEEENIIFDIHTYGPTVFTMQLEEKPVTYDDVFVIVGEEYRDGTASYSKELREEFKWTDWETDMLQLSKEVVNTGVVKISLKNVPGNSIIYIDNIVVEEYDQQGKYLRDVYECYFEQGAYRWTEYGDGELEVVQDGMDETGGSLCLMATKDKAEYIIKQTAASVNGMFEMNPAYQYKVRLAVNSNVKLEQGMLKIEIAGYQSDFIGGLDEFAVHTVEKYVRRREKTGEAQICNEFGCNFNCIKNGGEQYLYDVVGAFLKNKVNFCLFAYTGKDFGLMYDSNRDFGTDSCLIRQESYDVTYRALHQDMTYDHVFKNIDTMCSYDNIHNGQRVLVLGKEYAGVGLKYEYMISTEALDDSIVLSNGLCAKRIAVLE